MADGSGHLRLGRQHVLAGPDVPLTPQVPVAADVHELDVDDQLPVDSPDRAGHHRVNAETSARVTRRQPT